MSVAINISKNAIRLTSSVISLFVLVAIMLMLAFGGYTQWDASQVYRAADAEHFAKYKPTTANKGLTFKELQAINPEVCAWLTVYGTHIDYPVTQASDNIKYINTDATGQHSLSGSLFLDSSNAKDFSDFASIIFGHHMEKDTMFGEIAFFGQKSYFNDRRYGTLYYGGKRHGLEFFAFMHVDAYDSTVYHTKFTGVTARQTYLDGIERRALNLREGVTVSTDDRLVLLSTCSEDSTNGRDILVGRITDQVPADPFKTDDAQKKPRTLVDSLSGWWTQLPLGARIALIALPLLLVFLLLILLRRKKRAPREEQISMRNERDN